MSIENLGDIFKFVGGLGLFLYGMNAMAEGLQKCASGKMKKLLGYLTNNRLLGVIFGAIITAIIQSSSATTVMVVGFVNAGIMSLVQGVGVIMGANIGTTITAWIVSMSEWGAVMKPEFFAPLLVGIGIIPIMFMKKQRSKLVGEILVGFGVLFIGLTFMSGAIEPYRDAPIFSNMFATLGKNPVLGILAGAVVTAIIQSSSASVGILQALAINGIVNWRSAIFITLGQNIGTCVTALLSSAGAKKNAKRAAIIHLSFNVIGAVFFGIIMFILFSFNHTWANSSINTVEISVFHTIFNVTNTILLFPFANQLVKLSKKLIPDGKVGGEKESVVHQIEMALDNRILENPSFAIETANKEVSAMGRFVIQSAEHAMNGLLYKNEEDIQYVFEKENDINYLEKILTEYLVKVDNLPLSEEQHDMIKNLLYTVHDMERIGDHCENLAELSRQRIEGNLEFSKIGMSDMMEIIEQVMTGLRGAVSSRETMDFAEVRVASRAEDEVDNLEDELRTKHMMRLSEGKCKTESGLVFLDAITNLERISDHAYNIAGYVQSEI